MQVKIKLHHSLQRKTTVAVDGFLELEEGSTIEGLLQHLGFEQTTVVVTLNKTIFPKETMIQQEDLIEVYPIVIGG